MQWERNTLVISPDKHVAIRSIFESMAAHLDLNDAISLLGPMAHNDGTVTVKLVLVATHDFDDGCALIDEQHDPSTTSDGDASTTSGGDASEERSHAIQGPRSVAPAGSLLSRDYRPPSTSGQYIGGEDLAREHADFLAQILSDLETLGPCDFAPIRYSSAWLQKVRGFRSVVVSRIETPAGTIHEGSAKRGWVQTVRVVRTGFFSFVGFIWKQSFTF